MYCLLTMKQKMKHKFFLSTAQHSSTAFSSYPVIVADSSTNTLRIYVSKKKAVEAYIDFTSLQKKKKQPQYSVSPCFHCPLQISIFHIYFPTNCILNKLNRKNFVFSTTFYLPFFVFHHMINDDNNNNISNISNNQ